MANVTVKDGWILLGEVKRGTLRFCEYERFDFRSRWEWTLRDAEGKVVSGGFEQTREDALAAFESAFTRLFGKHGGEVDHSGGTV